MRSYSKVSSSFWTGRTGRALRGDCDAQIVALYLLTSPHASMIGVYHCPILYIAHETGIPFEGASKGLQRLVEGGFCTYEEDTETVWVHEMARFQVGESLKANDNRVKDIQRQFAEIPEGKIRRGFYERYKDAYILNKPPGEASESKPLASPLQAPSKPGTGTGTGTGTGAGTGAGESGAHTDDQPDRRRPDAPPSASPRLARGTRLPADWQLPDEWAEWALAEQPTWTPSHVRHVADCFRDYWTAKAGQHACKTDWLATWRNWVRSEGGRTNNRRTIHDERAHTIAVLTGRATSGRIIDIPPTAASGLD